MEKKGLKKIAKYSGSLFYDFIKYIILLSSLVCLFFFLSVLLEEYKRTNELVLKTKKAGDTFTTEEVCSDPKKRLEYEKLGYLDCEKAEKDRKKHIIHETFFEMLKKTFIADIVNLIKFLWSSLSTLVSSFGMMFSNVWVWLGIVATIVTKMKFFLKLIHFVTNKKIFD